MIEGKLVNLRALEMGDLERVTRWINDTEVTHFLGARYQMSMAAEEEWLRERTKTGQSFKDLAFAIETKDGEHIGNLGLHNVMPEDRRATLGIMIGEKGCWSKGYGGDAIVTLLGFGFGQMNLNRIDLTVFDFNQRAQACYRRCGFVQEGVLRQYMYKDGAYRDAVEMSILRDEFYSLHIEE